MTELRLARLPDRTVVRRKISLSPELDSALADYARAYEQQYGRAEPVELLIPAMLASFLASDRVFQGRRRQQPGDR
jgi:hypothetical protein